MNPTINIILRTDAEKKDKTYPIYLRLIINRKKKDIALNLSIDQDAWDPKERRVKKNQKDEYRTNMLLEKYELKARNILYDYRMKEKPLSFHDFMRHFISPVYDSDSFYDFVEHELGILKEKFSQDTIRLYQTQISKLKKFRPQLKLGEIDMRFIREYENYMISKLSNNPNTISKSLSFVRSVINKAIISDKLDENPFKNFPLKKIEGDRQFLVKSEVESLEALYEENTLQRKYQNVLRYFLFACWTGLRYRDIKELRFKNIQDDDMIIFKMHKTKDEVRIPVLKRAKKLLPEPGFKEQKVFRVLTDQPTNRYLKDIMKRAGINKKISFHCSRHTFATIAITAGMPIEVLSRILGHRDLRDTQIYGRIIDEKKIQEMKKLDI